MDEAPPNAECLPGSPNVAVMGGAPRDAPPPRLHLEMYPTGYPDQLEVQLWVGLEPHSIGRWVRLHPQHLMHLAGPPSLVVGGAPSDAPSQTLNLDVHPLGMPLA